MLHLPLTQRVEKGNVVVQLWIPSSMKSVHLFELPLCVGEAGFFQLKQLTQLMLGEVPETQKIKTWSGQPASVQVAGFRLRRVNVTACPLHKKIKAWTSQLFPVQVAGFWK